MEQMDAEEKGNS